MKKYKLPKGFLVNGIYCGIKKKRKDLGLIFSKQPCKTAAVFTKNKAKAAPVIVDQEILSKSKKINAVIVNSGNANCMTGNRGLKDARRMITSAAKALDVPDSKVLVSSTGIIGEFMPMAPVITNMAALTAGLNGDGVADLADSIMTTDKFPKVSVATYISGGKRIRMIGVAKGAGMIQPDMATMLCYIMTDANITVKALNKALKGSNDISFNAITVDGDMSTNDTVILLANGEAGNKTIKETGQEFKKFQDSLNKVALDLAKMVVKDGEGASKFIEVKVRKAKNISDAQKAASAIAGSMLVKCAVLGGDPNWGRIASSVGASGADMDTEKIVIKLDGMTFFSKGKTISHVNRKKTKVFKGEKVKIEVDLNLGKAEHTVYSCDISKKYITLNSYYTT